MRVLVGGRSAIDIGQAIGDAMVYDKIALVI
jgi:hypothetical protein